MKTQQPDFNFVANLGDCNPIEHGGFAVFADKTGIYESEAELLVSPEESGSDKWEVRRFSLDACTFINDILSDNKFHPDKPAWFADKLGAMANTFGQSVESVIALFVSADPIDRANAWRMVGEYFGYDNLDSYPRFFTRSEIKARWASYL